MTARCNWCCARLIPKISRWPSAASGEVKHRILANLSRRGAQMLMEDIEYQPPQRKRVVEQAQGRVVAIVRRLADAGTIVIARGDDDVVL